MKKQRLSVAYRTREIREMHATNNKQVWIFIIVIFTFAFIGAAMKP